jgi:hypothetical protein
VLAALPLAAVALVVEFDVEHVDGPVEAFEPSELLRDIGPEVVWHLDVATLHHHLCAGGFGLIHHFGGIHELT